MRFTNIPPGSRRKFCERDKVFAVCAETHAPRWVWDRWKAGAVAAHRAVVSMRQARTVGNGSKVALPVSQKTWLASMPSTQLVSGNRKREAPPQATFEQERQRQYEEQRDILSREGVFWCKHTETFESREEGKPSKAVSGLWFHNRKTSRIEKYGDLQQPPVHTREVFFSISARSHTCNLRLQPRSGQPEILF